MQNRTAKKIDAYNCPVATSVKVLDDYILQTTFNNGVIKVYDFKPNFRYKVFSKLKDKDFFKGAYLDHGAIAWSDDYDIAIEEVYEAGKTIS